MTTTDTGKASVESIIAHYGIPGMKWGRRRSRAQLEKEASKRDDSPDAPEHTRSRELNAVAKTQGIRKLNNKDLQDLTQRLNLEQQYARLSTPPDSAKKAQGRRWVAGKLASYSNMALDEVVKGQIKVQLKNQGLVPK